MPGLEGVEHLVVEARAAVADDASCGPSSSRLPPAPPCPAGTYASPGRTPSSSADAVLRVDEDAAGLVGAAPRRRRHLREGGDDHDVAGLHQVGGGAVHADLAGAAPRPRSRRCAAARRSCSPRRRPPRRAGCPRRAAGRRRSRCCPRTRRWPRHGGAMDLALQHACGSRQVLRRRCGGSTGLSIRRTSARAARPRGSGRRARAASGRRAAAGAGSRVSGSRSSA